MTLVGPDPPGIQNRRDEATKDRVVAVVTERSDGTCNLYMGFSQRKASLAAAQYAVEAQFESVAWSERPPGVWVARGQNSTTLRDDDMKATRDKTTLGGDFDDDAQDTAS